MAQWYTGLLEGQPSSLSPEKKGSGHWEDHPLCLSSLCSTEKPRKGKPGIALTDSQNTTLWKCLFLKSGTGEQDRHDSHYSHGQCPHWRTTLAPEAQTSATADLAVKLNTRSTRPTFTRAPYHLATKSVKQHKYIVEGLKVTFRTKQNVQS